VTEPGDGLSDAADRPPAAAPPAAGPPAGPPAIVPPGAFQPPPGAPGAEPQLVTIGQIVVTPTRVVTPSGTVPVSSVSWSFQDLTRTSTAIPTWAIVCCILFVLVCLLGLLFLLAKEERTEGWVQVTVQGPGLLYNEQIPVSDVRQVMDLNARVNYARSITVSAGPPR
jgi:hypothetical protein